jgi:hypothetical protein
MQLDEKWKTSHRLADVRKPGKFRDKHTDAQYDGRTGVN